MGDVSGALTELRHFPKNPSSLDASSTDNFTSGLYFIAVLKVLIVGFSFMITTAELYRNILKNTLLGDF